MFSSNKNIHLKRVELLFMINKYLIVRDGKIKP